ncbi:MAG: FG-GAP-like repeat-containing protein [Acetobacteraceae bacterium]|nr:FG-GAP-like repeat-containing protein [Acetobacteraceae bacterium]
MAFALASLAPLLLPASGGLAGGADVNGDGRPDLLLGLSGGARLWLGAGGAVLSGDGVGDALALGDVNGDGWADLLLGAPLADNAELELPGTGLVHLLPGGPPGWADAALADIGIRITGAGEGDRLGQAVAVLGDVNGDGFGDMLLGAPGASIAGRHHNGAAWLLLGGPGARADLNLALPTGPDALRLYGADGDALGSAVAAVGDVNGDGLADMLLGAPGGTGAAILVLGDRGEWGDLDLAEGMPGLVRITGGPGLGAAVAGAGDVNGDGLADLLLGGAGAAWLLFGKAEGWADLDLQALAAADGIRLTGVAGLTEVAGLGDVNGDGLADLGVGDPAAGQVAVLLGHRGAWGDVDLTGPAPNLLRITGPGLGAELGAAGDQDGDGRADLLLGGAEGTWLVTGGALPRPVVTGSEDLGGRGKGDLLWFNGSFLYRWAMDGPGRAGEGALGGPGEGWSLAAKGDLDGDGRSDLMWQHQDGRLHAWTMNGAGVKADVGLGLLAAGQGVVGLGDTDGDGRAEAVLRAADGIVTLRRPDGAQATLGWASPDWDVASVADLDGDGRADLLLRHRGTGEAHAWMLDGRGVRDEGSLGNPGLAWNIAAVVDLSGDGRADIVWQNAAGGLWGWITGADGRSVATQGWIGGAGGGWRFSRAADYSGDGKADLVFTDADHGYAWMWRMDGLSIVESAAAGVAGPGWFLL